MNLRNANAKKLLPSEDDLKAVLHQARDAPELMAFITALLSDRIMQMDEINSDDPNWVIKRAMKDGRQAELKLLYTILCED